MSAQWTSSSTRTSGARLADGLEQIADRFEEAVTFGLGLGAHRLGEPWHQVVEVGEERGQLAPEWPELVRSWSAGTEWT